MMRCFDGSCINLRRERSGEAGVAVMCAAGSSIAVSLHLHTLRAVTHGLDCGVQRFQLSRYPEPIGVE